MQAQRAAERRRREAQHHRQRVPLGRGASGAAGVKRCGGADERGAQGVAERQAPAHRRCRARAMLAREEQLRVAALCHQVRRGRARRVVRDAHARQMPDPPAGPMEAVAPVDLLGVQEEALVQASDGLDRLAARDQERTDQPVGCPGARSARPAAPPRARLPEPPARRPSASPSASQGEGKRLIESCRLPSGAHWRRLRCRSVARGPAVRGAPRNCRSRLSHRGSATARSDRVRAPRARVVGRREADVGLTDHAASG